MKASAVNIPEILNKVLDTARLVTADDWLHKKVLFDIKIAAEHLDKMIMRGLFQNYQIMSLHNPGCKL